VEGPKVGVPWGDDKEMLKSTVIDVRCGLRRVELNIKMT
jgi:hypothetical protein